MAEQCVTFTSLDGKTNVKIQIKNLTKYPESLFCYIYTKGRTESVKFPVAISKGMANIQNFYEHGFWLNPHKLENQIAIDEPGIKIGHSYAKKEAEKIKESKFDEKKKKN